MVVLPELPVKLLSECLKRLDARHSCCRERRLHADQGLRLPSGNEDLKWPSEESRHAYKCAATAGRWLDKRYVPDFETVTASAVGVSQAAATQSFAVTPGLRRMFRDKSGPCRTRVARSPGCNFSTGLP